LLEAADTLHKEFIQVGSHHCQEKNPLQKGNPFILALVQDSAIKASQVSFPVGYHSGIQDS
jgi:hypothetical protein